MTKRALQINVTGHDKLQDVDFGIVFKAYEIVNPEALYGNKTYIAIYKEGETQPWRYVDCRYVTDYTFTATVEGIMKAYFGENLQTITIKEVQE